MLDILKSIGACTDHEYSHDQILRSLPPRKNDTQNNEKRVTVDENIWFDKIGIRYCLSNNNLFISAKEQIPESIIDYINAIPNNLDIKVIITIDANVNEVAGFNALCSALTYKKCNKEIILNVSDLRFGLGCTLEIDKLPMNVKISNCIDLTKRCELQSFYGENSFDWWALHCSDENFKILISKLTDVAKKRAMNLRKIAYNFYRSLPDAIKKANNKEKCDFVYEWCCRNISYDTSGTIGDGSLNYDRRDTQDPIVTFNKRKGVCAGRARLLKVLLNNCYMKVPIFLVHGMAGKLQHEWNELITDDGKSIFYDISKMPNLSNDFHDDYLLSKIFMDERRQRLSN